MAILRLASVGSVTVACVSSGSLHQRCPNARQSSLQSGCSLLACDRYGDWRDALPADAAHFDPRLRFSYTVAMKRIGLAVLVVLLTGSAAQALPITYILSVGAGTNAVNGTITTDGTLGDLPAADITTWAFHAIGAPMFDISGTAVSVLCSPSSACFTATTTGLFAKVGSLAVFNAPNPFVAIGDGDSDTSVAVAADTITHSGFFGGAQVGTAAVPEPSTLVLLGSALAAWCGGARKRARQRQSTAV